MGRFFSAFKFDTHRLFAPKSPNFDAKHPLKKRELHFTFFTAFPPGACAWEGQPLPPSTVVLKMGQNHEDTVKKRRLRRNMGVSPRTDVGLGLRTGEMLPPAAEHSPVWGEKRAKRCCWCPRIDAGGSPALSCPHRGPSPGLDPRSALGWVRGGTDGRTCRQRGVKLVGFGAEPLGQKGHFWGVSAGGWSRWLGGGGRAPVCLSIQTGNCPCVQPAVHPPCVHPTVRLSVHRPLSPTRGVGGAGLWVQLQMDTRTVGQWSV